MIDVTGKLPQAKELLEKVTKTQLGAGAKRSEVKVEGCPDPVIQFDLPELEEEKEAAAAPCKAARRTKRRRQKPRRPKPPAPAKPADRQAFYCLTGNLLVVTDNWSHEGHLGPRAGRQQGLAWPTTSRFRW